VSCIGRIMKILNKEYLDLSLCWPFGSAGVVRVLHPVLPIEAV
jgi:hypothetical protein